MGTGEKKEDNLQRTNFLFLVALHIL